MAVSSFYDLFPKINYDIENRRLQPQYEQVTNIFHRLGVVRDVINNIGSYIVYDIEDGDTPEIVAHKVYGDAGGFWLILLANNIMDGQFEWPLDPNSFNQFVIEKYGSIENALITPHHYEKVIIRRNTRTGFESVTRFVVNGERLTENMPPEIPFSYYEPWTSTTYRTADSSFFKSDNESPDLLADLDNGEPFGASLDRGNLALTGELIQPEIYTINGEPIEIVIKGEIVYQYEHEKRLNDERRSIKVIKKEYYVQIQDELKAMMSNKPSYIRRVF
jgi:hypothetical protein